MNPTAEALRPAVTPPEEQQTPEIIATFQDETGNRIPLTKDCVQVIFVQDRPYLDHCLITLEDQTTFLKAPEETVERLLEAGVPATHEADIAPITITMYANYMSKRHGAAPLPELIPANPPAGLPEQAL